LNYKVRAELLLLRNVATIADCDRQGREDALSSVLSNTATAWHLLMLAQHWYENMFPSKKKESARSSQCHDAAKRWLPKAVHLWEGGDEIFTPALHAPPFHTAQHLIVFFFYILK